ncbi:MAG: glycosyltransferase family 2 protein [Syntrophaceae bacterium]|nr:glycosyltransferase family 2 protein [Syntrophaceae bacterium]
MDNNNYTYVLITPARNEEAFIGQTIESVISQTILPKKWIIVSDGSTDRTDEIVTQHLAKNPWIELLRMPEHRDRHFAAKVSCFNAGYDKVKNIPYNIIGNLDADVTFDSTYFEYILSRFIEDPNLGVAGTPYLERGSHSYKDSYVDIHHVHGQIQMFRRQCYEDIGGYTPIKGGGIDWVAVTTARMKTWKTYSFQDKVFIHHRRMGTGGNSVLESQFNYGKKNYFLGSHPLWHLFRSLYQMTKKPYVIGGLLLLAGYNWAFLTGVEKPISNDLIKYYRKEQMDRLKELAFRTFRLDRK